MDYLVIFILLALGLFLLLMEIFIPSYGLLTVGALGSLVAALVMAFGLSPAFGMGCLVATLILLPIEIILGVKIFPHTWMGHRIVLSAREATGRTERSTDDELFALVGREGFTTTACRPSGVAEIDQRRVDVVAEGTMIDADRPIRVMAVDGNRVVVREREA
jgi:membrane-bound serine protease (ClpP class)